MPWRALSWHAKKDFGVVFDRYVVVWGVIVLTLEINLCLAVVADPAISGFVKLMKGYIKCSV